jgi:hypothetical protein
MLSDMENSKQSSSSSSSSSEGSNPTVKSSNQDGESTNQQRIVADNQMDYNKVCLAMKQSLLLSVDPLSRESQNAVFGEHCGCATKCFHNDAKGERHPYDFPVLRTVSENKLALKGYHVIASQHDRLPQFRLRCGKEVSPKKHEETIADVIMRSTRDITLPSYTLYGVIPRIYVTGSKVRRKYMPMERRCNS